MASVSNDNIHDIEKQIARYNQNCNFFEMFLDTVPYNARKFYSMIRGINDDSFIDVKTRIERIQQVNAYQRSMLVEKRTLIAEEVALIGTVLFGLPTLVTIFTTYLIIKRSYKVDNHQERMSALPHFRLYMVPVEKDRMKMRKKLERTAQCYIRDCGPDSIVLAVENVGKDEAFDVVVMGRGLDDGVFIKSMHVGEKKYLMFEYTPGYEIKIQYEDIYGNRYYQRFEPEVNENKIWFNARIPELILRTDRVRYQQ